MRIFFLILLFTAISGHVFSQPYGTWTSNPYPTKDPVSLYIIDTSMIFGIKYYFPVFGYKSTNQGNTWDSTALLSPLDTMDLNHENRPSTAISFFTSPKSNSLFAFQLPKPNFIASYDSGRTWVKLRDSLEGLKYLIYFKMTSDQSGFILYADSQKHVAITHDACKSFTVVTDTVLLNFFSNNGPTGLTTIADDSLNWVIWKGSATSAFSQLIVTHNGGLNWKAVPVLSPSGDSASLSGGGGGYRFAMNDMYVIGPSLTRPFAYYSTDYGDSWHTTDTIMLLSGLSSCIPLTHNSFLALGWLEGGHTAGFDDPTVIYYTSDAGKHWEADSVIGKSGRLGKSFLISFDSLHVYTTKYGTDNTRFILSLSPKNSSVVSDTKYTSNECLYPNPTQGILHVPLSIGIKQIHIHNILGVEIYQSQLSSDNIDLSNFPDGVYMAELDLADRTIIQKVIKRNP